VRKCIRAKEVDRDILSDPWWAVIGAAGLTRVGERRRGAREHEGLYHGKGVEGLGEGLLNVRKGFY